MKKFLSGVLISLAVVATTFATIAQADPASNATVGIYWHGNIP